MDILEEKGNEMKIPGFKKDKLIMLIDDLVTRLAYSDKDTTKSLKTNGYVSLNAKVMEQQIGKYLPYLNLLKSEGIIECNESYLTDKYSKGYRFTDAYADFELKKVEITDWCLIKKSKKFWEMNNKPSSKNCYHLKKWFNNKLLKIDYQGALNWIAQNEKNEILNKKRKKGKIDIKLKHQGYRIMVESFKDHRYFHEQNRKNKRFYSNLCSLKSELRRFITYDGKQMVSIDIKNSQPYFSILLFQTSFWEKLNSKKKIEKYFYDRDMNIEDIYYIIMLVKTMESHDCIDFQTKVFVETVINGSFYEYLVDLFKRKSIIPNDMDNHIARRTVKTMVLTFLFDNDYKFYKTKSGSAFQIFKNEFPKVVGLFEAIKKRHYKQFAVLLQRIESEFVIEKICERIDKEYKHIPIFTIHDCIVTTEGNEGIVKQIVNDVLLTEIGKAPKLKIEPWCIECDNEFQIAA